MNPKNDPTTQRYVSIPEYAQSLGVSRITVYTRVKKGLIPAKKIGRNYVVLLDKSAPTAIEEPHLHTDHCSVAQLAKKLGISRIAVFQRIQAGKIAAVKCGRNYIIPTDVDLTSVKKSSSALSKKLIVKVKDYISIPELAKELGISRVEVFHRVKAGKIQAEKIGRNYVVDRQSVFSAQPPRQQQKKLAKELVSIPELARERGVSRVSIFHKVKSGAIKARKIGRNYVIARKDLEPPESQTTRGSE